MPFGTHMLSYCFLLKNKKLFAKVFSYFSVIFSHIHPGSCEDYFSRSLIMLQIIVHKLSDKFQIITFKHITGSKKFITKLNKIVISINYSLCATLSSMYSPITLLVWSHHFFLALRALSNIL